jgi:hypothetical protein
VRSALLAEFAASTGTLASRQSAPRPAIGLPAENDRRRFVAAAGRRKTATSCNEV